MECHEQDDLYSQMLLLLPPGRAFQSDDQGGRAADSLIKSFFHALSTEVVLMEDAICDAFTEAFCHSAVADLDLWLNEYGLPDPCDPFGENLCAKVSTTGEEGGSTAYLEEIADRLGWIVVLTWLKGAHPDYPGVRSTLLLEIDIENSPAITLTSFDNWIIGQSPFGGSVTAEDLEQLLCNYAKVLPAHLGFVYRNLPTLLAPSGAADFTLDTQSGIIAALYEDI